MDHWLGPIHTEGSKRVESEGDSHAVEYYESQNLPTNSLPMSPPELTSAALSQIRNSPRFSFRSGGRSEESHTRASESRNSNLAETPESSISDPFIPRSISESILPLVLSHGSIEHTFPVPGDLHYLASHILNRFISSLVTPSAPETDSAPKCEVELVAKYLEYSALGDLSGPEEKVVRLILKEFEKEFLDGKNIHILAAGLPVEEQTKQCVIRSYYTARAAISQNIEKQDSALLRAVDNGAAKLYAIFGGQGNTTDYFKELRTLYGAHQSFLKELLVGSAPTLLSLSKGCKSQHAKDLDVMKWLRDPNLTPTIDYMVSAPVSFPLIGLLQLAQYCVTCRALGRTPGQLRKFLSGTTGHSQGVVVAAAIAASDTWDSFYKYSNIALTTLFWIGARCQQIYPTTSLAPSIVQDSVNHEEGVPSPMLSVRGLSQAQIQEHIDATNHHLPKHCQISIALINSLRNFVIAGPPISLYGFNVRLRQFKANGLDQTRVPFSNRKVPITNRFLPITAPFHSKHVAGAVAAIEKDLTGIEINCLALGIPVFDTSTGNDIRGTNLSNIVPMLVRMVAEHTVNWEIATAFPNATHIIDFGPGGLSGVGILTSRNKEGTGTRLILAGVLTGISSEIDYKAILFDHDDKSLIYNMNWANVYRPKLIRTSTGQIYVDTKLSRLLGVPPIMVAGMTPCTVAWDFVSAAMNAGYHIELAGGGYYNEKALVEALENLQMNVPVGRGITINLLYVNPHAIAWQIPLIRKLRADGMLIDGITIGAGVPSLEIASEWIETLGLRHIAFKPGSIEAVQSVVAIANAHPNFPIILQWTGGRGGGHHSFEDFHQPILSMYSRVRKCQNIILVAGSGFGGFEDTYPYLTGTWSLKYGYAAMPFDGCLFGSRMMTAKEAHTSIDAKRAITEAEGVEPHQWEKTYKGSAGGVITVMSEMGEPIHKLATRGVKFWAEMDQQVFSVPKSRRVIELKRRRNYIIKKLNDDFQKVWFGANSAGEPLDLDQMTYGEVARRMVDLLYLKTQKRWIDISFQKLTADFLRRIEERFTTKNDAVSVLRDQTDLANEDPYRTVQTVLLQYPEANKRLLAAQDYQYFLILTLRPGQKPVTFVPVLDENFEFYFKKDSLWQSENLEAVIGQDIGRTCILQGPVAVKYSKIVNEPIKAILDNIHHGHINLLTKELYDGRLSRIPTVEYFSGQDAAPVLGSINGLIATNEPDVTTYSLSSDPEVEPPSLQEWLTILAGPTRSWRQALFLSETIIVGHNKFQQNPIKRLVAPVRGLIVRIVYPDEPVLSSLVFKEWSPSSSKYIEILDIRLSFTNEISVKINNNKTATGLPVPLQLKYTYHPDTGYAPIRESMDNRNSRIKEFYWRTWFGDEKMDPGASLTAVFDGGKANITREGIAKFIRVIGNNDEAYIARHDGKAVFAPMDFAIVIGWKAMIKPIFPIAIDGDLLKLVHLSNSFSMAPDATPLKEGDEVETTSQITAVTIQDAGKMVEVCGTITRDGAPVMEIISQFLYRGVYTDFETTFQRKKENSVQVRLDSTKDVAILRSKSWFILEDPHVELLGQVLTFNVQSLIRFQSKLVFRSIHTHGQVLMTLPSKKLLQIATIDYKVGESIGNAVISYLDRHGHRPEQPVSFEAPIELGGKLVVQAPESNDLYADVSGDYNPIHTSRMFYSYVGLPGTITHGMYTSAAIRALVDKWAGESQSGRAHSFSASLVGMVLPNDELEVQLRHIGMLAGRKIIEVEAVKQNGEKVLVGRAEIEQPLTAYIFTGQGSQEVGMGMDLYATSAVARDVWNRADKYFMENFGFAITNIVKHNPKELTIFFGGPRGKAIRKNYMSMVFHKVADDGSVHPQKLFPEIDENMTSYTYRCPNGTLFATQFTQPALTLMEKAHYEDLKSKGLIRKNSSFAGHSLGEYGALSTVGNVLSVENLMSIVFFRGLTMQVVVDFDIEGRSNYSMVAVNPSKVSETFDEHTLKYVVGVIAKETEWLLEIVNYNISNMQYVCAGELSALDCLASVVDSIKGENIDIRKLIQTHGSEKVTFQLIQIVQKFARETAEKPKPLELKRGVATIPLAGVAVPFHSSFLRSGVKSYRKFLKERISSAAIDPEDLVGKWIPNITGKPFGISKKDFEEVYKLTESAVLADILANWDSYDLPEDDILATGDA